MSSEKRKLEADNISENDSFNNFKRLKVDFDDINAIIKEKHPDIDITNHKIFKFLTIFEALLYSKDIENTDSEDGVQDIIILVVTTLLKLLKENINKLDLPTKIKKALNKLHEMARTRAVPR